MNADLEEGREGGTLSRADSRERLYRRRGAGIELGYTYEQLALVPRKPTAEAARLAVRRALLRLARELHRA